MAPRMMTSGSTSARGAARPVAMSYLRASAPWLDRRVIRARESVASSRTKKCTLMHHPFQSRTSSVCGAPTATAMATVKLTCAMLHAATIVPRGFARADVARGPLFTHVWCQGWVREDDGATCAVRDGTGDVRVERRARCASALREGAYVVVRGTLASDGDGRRVVREADVVHVEDASVARARADAWMVEVDEVWEDVFAVGLGCD